MSTVVEDACGFLGLSKEEYDAQVDPVVGKILVSWSPVSVRHRGTAVRFAVQALTFRLDPPGPARVWRVRDWIIRTELPTWLEALGAASEAKRLRRLPRLTEWTVDKAGVVLREVYAVVRGGRWDVGRSPLLAQVLAERLVAETGSEGIHAVAEWMQTDASWLRLKRSVGEIVRRVTGASLARHEAWDREAQKASVLRELWPVADRLALRALRLVRQLLP